MLNAGSEENDGTFGTVTTNLAKWTRIADILYFTIKATGTTAGAPSSIEFSLPSTPDTAAGLVGGGARIVDGGNILPGTWDDTGAGAFCRVFVEDGGDWGDGAGRSFTIQGFYQEAS